MILLHIKIMETYCVSCEKILRPKILVSKELNKIDYLLVARKNPGSLKVKEVVD